MSPSAVQTNDSPKPNSGILTPTQADATENQWTPETVLSTLPHRPQSHTTSPIPFFHLLSRLKTTKREGWRRFAITHGESIADHMYRMSMITMLCPTTLASKLDLHKCTKMALVHDLAEALVGDITPVDGVAKSEKSRREEGTMEFVCRELLGEVEGGVVGRELRALWQEYEDGVTLESCFVHDVDKIELLLQMVEYERVYEGELDLGEFSRVAGRVGLEEVRVWAAEVLEERRVFWDAKGVVPKGEQDVGDKRKRQQDEYYQGAAGGEGEGDGVSGKGVKEAKAS
ncbi:hypothetical protein MBLNU230_g3284t1 [Neophaeotheca triangularis]